MSSRETPENKGSFRIHEDVIISIIRKVLVAIPGVVRIAGNSLLDNISEIIGSRRIGDRSIQIEMGESTVSVAIELVIKSGFRVKETAGEAQRKIAEEITRLTGLHVDKVHILIREIEETQENIE